MPSPLVSLSTASQQALEMAQAVFIDIGAADIANGKVDEVVDRLKRLSADPRLAARLEDCAELVIDGYSRDPRELYEIPEVRTFFRAVTARWPYWLHFVNVGGESVRNVLLQMVDAKVLDREGGLINVWFPPEQLEPVLRTLFDGMNEMQEIAGRGDYHTCKRSDRIIEALGI